MVLEDLNQNGTFTSTNGTATNEHTNETPSVPYYPRVAFIGGGNMAEAILGGLIRTGYPATKISISEPISSRADFFSTTYPGLRVLEGDNPAAVTGAKSAKLRNSEEQDVNSGEGEPADVIVFAVKPQILRPVAIELKETVQKTRPLVVSIVAGIRTKDIARWLGDPRQNGTDVSNEQAERPEDEQGHIVQIVRCMPNTPALVLEGAAGLYADQHVSIENKVVAEGIITSIAKKYFWVDNEELINTVTALSGSGPAYCFLLMEVMGEYP